MKKKIGKNVSQKIKNNKLKDKNINLNSESDSDSDNNKMNYKNHYSPRKNKLNNNKLLGNKIKKEKLIEDSNESEENEFNINYNNTKNKKIKKNLNEENIVTFPYEFTERLIEALSCDICKGIYIRPYVINTNGCGHIYCLGCITKLLEDKESGMCPKCKNHFTERNVKYSEVTDYYIKIFFPEIPKIIEDNKSRLNKFMGAEAMKLVEKNNQGDKIKKLKCEIRPFKENVSHKHRLPEISNNHNKFLIKIDNEKFDVVNAIKKEVTKRLNMTGVLNSDNIDIRMQGVEISTFTTFEGLNKCFNLNLNENNIFYYSKKEDN